MALCGKHPGTYSPTVPGSSSRVGHLAVLASRIRYGLIYERAFQLGQALNLAYPRDESKGYSRNPTLPILSPHKVP